ncbi:MAG: GH32 C-terminal domain-containing protein, partial [Bacteroidota bacterium]
PEKPFKFQLFIDGSVIEGFINDQQAFTTRIFPSSEDSNEIEMFTKDGSLMVNQLDFWTLKSSNNQVDF